MKKLITRKKFEQIRLKNATKLGKNLKLFKKAL